VAKKVVAKPKQRAASRHPPRHERVCNLVPSADTQADGSLRTVASGALGSWRHYRPSICARGGGRSVIKRHRIVRRLGHGRCAAIPWSSGQAWSGEPLSPGSYGWRQETDRYTTLPGHSSRGQARLTSRPWTLPEKRGVVTSKHCHSTWPKMYTGDENAFYAGPPSARYPRTSTCNGT
jgi:hypothetical protein